MVDQERRPCPFCQERIVATALKCRFCGEFLDVEHVVAEGVPAWPPPEDGTARLPEPTGADSDRNDRVTDDGPLAVNDSLPGRDELAVSTKVVWVLVAGLAVSTAWAVLYSRSQDESSQRPRPATAAAAGTTTKPPPTTVAPRWELECPGLQVQVVYNGSATAGYGYATYATPSGTSQGSPDLPIKMSTDSTAKGLHFCADPDEFFYISLQNPHDSGQIACSITVDGQLIASNRSSGAYVIAQCDG